MKDLLEPFLYPHNLFLAGLLLACICYRKKGLWLLLAWYYLAGNSLVANQVRQWYSEQQAIVPTEQYVVLGCGGSATEAPACAKSRLERLVQILPTDKPADITITTRFCEPYVTFLHSRYQNAAIQCFNGGDNTYQEFYSLAKTLDKTGSVTVVTSDYHRWRVQQLFAYHQLEGQVIAAGTQTFRQVNCNANCMFTVNLTNYDFYSKLLSEFSSYAVYVLTRNWTDWAPDDSL